MSRTKPLTENASFFCADIADVYTTDMRTLPSWLGHVMALVISPLAAFFIVFNVIFSDIFGLATRVYAFLFVLIVYTILGFAFGKLFSSKRRAWKLWLLIPPTILVALFSLSEFSPLVVYNLAILGAAALGVFLGNAFAKR